MTIRKLLAAACVVLALSACNFNLNEITPTVEGIEEPINPLPQATDITPTQEETLTPSPSPTVMQVVLENPVVPTGVATVEAITHTPTVGPYEYVVKAGDSLLGIATGFGYTAPSIVDEIVRLNGLSSAESIREGQRLLIPRQTAVPTAPGLEITLTQAAEQGIYYPPLFSEGTTFSCHTIESGDTAIGIAEAYKTTLEILAQLNPAMGWSGCDPSNPGGGPQCNPQLRIGDCMQVPLPTPTRTLSPTPSGSETPTPTPTYAPPRLYSPPDGAEVRGLILLHWVSAGQLQADEYYIVELIELDPESREPLPGIEPIRRPTRETSLQMPLEILPTAGQPRLFEWNVIVARQSESGRFTAVGGTGSPRHFVIKP